MRRGLRAAVFSLWGAVMVPTAPAAVSAQTPIALVRGPAPSPLRDPRVVGPFRQAWSPDPSDSVAKIRPTYWKEGAIVGGVVGGIGLGLLAARFCAVAEETDENCTGATLVGGLLGAVILGVPGALIGGSLPKGGRETHQGIE
jgi:hypothetical protein